MRGNKDIYMKSLSCIKAVTIDVDDTLWDFKSVMRRGLQAAHDELTKLDPESARLLDIERMARIRLDVFDRLKGIETNLEKLRLEAFRESLASIGRPDNMIASRLNDIYFQNRFVDIGLYEDILPTLNALKSHFTLGILSNGNSYPDKCGLDGIFDFAVFSQDYEIEKPDPRLFEVAIEKAKCRPDELLHVGDSLESDIAGANTAGVKSAWLNRNNAVNNTSYIPDFEIASLRNLLEILPLSESVS